jgi:hypothetical protein
MLRATEHTLTHYPIHMSGLLQRLQRETNCNSMRFPLDMELPTCTRSSRGKVLHHSVGKVWRSRCAGSCSDGEDAMWKEFLCCDYRGRNLVVVRDARKPILNKAVGCRGEPNKYWNSVTGCVFSVGGFSCLKRTLYRLSTKDNAELTPSMVTQGANIKPPRYQNGASRFPKLKLVLKNKSMSAVTF